MPAKRRYQTRLAFDTSPDERYAALVAEILGDDLPVDLDAVELRQVVEELLAKARWSRRVQALRLRYGLGNGQEPQTYRAVGARLGPITAHGAMHLIEELRQWLRPRLRTKLRAASREKAAG